MPISIFGLITLTPSDVRYHTVDVPMSRYNKGDVVGCTRNCGVDLTIKNPTDTDVLCPECAADMYMKANPRTAVTRQSQATAYQACITLDGAVWWHNSLRNYPLGTLPRDNMGVATGAGAIKSGFVGIADAHALQEIHSGRAALVDYSMLERLINEGYVNATGARLTEAGLSKAGMKK